MVYLLGMCLDCCFQRDPATYPAQCPVLQTMTVPVGCDSTHPVVRGHKFRGMSTPPFFAVSPAGGVRHGAEPDPHIVELSKLMLARAPELGQALADRLFREIDAYRDGTVVTKDEVVQVVRQT